ncbi:Integrin beta-1 [Desmophyllum pertusum]|uniref:Integrin beta n=1 Tax=Desmophyllum pertusum TaxID=174260 RepID=A0A9X0D0D5_9CNID|nr:Integrin beta-1 [Desmophyllum pertusum]
MYQELQIILSWNMTTKAEILVIVFFSCGLLLLCGGSTAPPDCRQYKTCTECIVSSPECSWCEDTEYHNLDQPRRRCDLYKNHQQNKCQNISNPGSGSTVHSNKAPDSDVKVSPQNLTLHLRPGVQTTITINVLTPKDFPVDLYYLTDVSRSIKKESIKSLGHLLADEISNLTSRFRLGLGAFVDKPLAPYMDTDPVMIAHPDPKNLNSTPTFGYRNVLSLNKNASNFQAAIEKLMSSGNVDNPEGGLDALVQVAACEKEIGWKNKEDARRVVVLTTDAAYHFAGDGLLGGVVTPNDGLCHLKGQEYNASTTMDYPSPGLVREILLESNVVPIFAVTSKEKAIYEELAKFLGNETYAEIGELQQDSSSIVRVIGEAYKKIARKVTIRDANSEGLRLRYTAVCPKGKVYEDTKTCTGVELGDTVSFRVSVSMTNCSDDLPTNFSIKTPYGHVFLKLSYVCSCECERKENLETNSSRCNHRGSLKCGICSCNDGWAGEHCSCTEEDERKGCPSSNNGDTCSGEGSCSCGKCYCKDTKDPKGLLYGDTCECDTLSCPKDPENDEICGGSERGFCDCGQCNCTENWSGPSCSCSRDLNGCTKNGVLCSGRGTCRCGACVCNASLPYRGPFCDECLSCIGTCEANRACVQCRMFGTGELVGKECSRKCKDFKITPVDKLTPAMGKQCRFLDEDDCYLGLLTQ